jgi:hypothetical protein
MATRASDYKRVTSKSRCSPDYVASKREDRPLTTRQKAKLRKESSRVMHQSARIHSETCGTYTTRVVPSGKGQLKCHGCGRLTVTTDGETDPRDGTSLPAPSIHRPVRWRSAMTRDYFALASRSDGR